MKKHELDWVSLIAGAVFLLVAVTHLVGAAAGDDPDLRWLVPAMLVGVGVAGLTGALRSSRPRPAAVAPATDLDEPRGGRPERRHRGAGRGPRLTGPAVRFARPPGRSDILCGARQVARAANGSGL